VAPDSSGNFTFYVGKNSSGEQVGMLSYIKIKKHATEGAGSGDRNILRLNTSADQFGGAAANGGDPERNPVSILYPNPTTGQFRVSFTTPVEKAGLELLDAGGRALQQRIVSGGQVEIDISPFPAGVYTLRVLRGNNVFTYKVVKR
jgi:hypothetical protein